MHVHTRMYLFFPIVESIHLHLSSIILLTPFSFSYAFALFVVFPPPPQKNIWLGMDTYKRRQTWDLLLHERKDKTILLSTHDMEEAEVLGDHIAIMVDGQVR